MRPVIGLQLLMAQGFPADMKLNFDVTNADDMDLYKFGCLAKFVEDTGKSQVNDAELRSMAGNTRLCRLWASSRQGSRDAKKSNIFRRRSQ